MAEKRMLSDSSVQRTIEKEMFEKLKEMLECEDLRNGPMIAISAENGVYIEPDLFSEEKRIIGEIHAHRGKLKVAQQNKLKGDILKMLLFEHSRKEGPFRKIIAVCDRDELKQLQGKSFLAESIRQFGVELIYIELTDQQDEMLRTAMKNQNLMIPAES